MSNSANLMKELVKITNHLGLSNVSPHVLSDAGNIIIHLSPYPIVARIAKLFAGDDPDFWKDIWIQELKVVKHLLNHKVPVAPFTTQVPPGPHKIGSTWMTFWEYLNPLDLPPLEGANAIGMLNDMTLAMTSYNEPLSMLGAWKNVEQAADNLKKRKDKDVWILKLLEEFEKINQEINQFELFPAHGDAHPNNLIPSSKGWLWIDFEDVSLMPKFWDLASFIGNTALFHGFQHPMVRYVLNLKEVENDKEMFLYVLRARVVMSATTNLSLAFEENGDLDFAQKQLRCLNEFLSKV